MICKANENLKLFSQLSSEDQISIKNDFASIDAKIKTHNVQVHKKF